MALAETTTYRVETLYDVTDRASKALQEISVAAEKAGKNTETLKTVLIGLGVGGLMTRAFSAGKSALIDFNSAVDKAKISLATVTAMNLKAPFLDAKVATDKLYETFQRMAAQSPATTQDFINMANSISSGVLQAGLGLKGLETITKGAITAGAALGAPAEMLALDVTQMLAGTVAIRDRYARQLLAGIGETDYKKFNAYSAVKRAQLVEKSFDQPSLRSAADAFGESFVGVTSTLKDNLEIGLGKVGLPLFKAITAEVKRWNDWMTANQFKMEAIGKTIGDGLVKGFQMAKSAAQFLVDNAGTLLEIGKVWLLFKIGGGLGGTLSGAFGGAAGLAKGFGKSSWEDGLKQFAKNLTSGGPGYGGPLSRQGMAYGVGSSISGAAGLVGAMQSIGIGGALQIGLISHELGEYLGVHKAITAVIDPQRSKYEQLIESMKMWDDALIKSRDKLAGREGATGTLSYASATGASDARVLQAEAMKDAIRLLVSKPELAEERLLKGGLTQDEAYRFLGAKPEQRTSMMMGMREQAANVQSTADMAASITGTWVNKAMGAFSESERSSIDLKEGTQRVYELIHRMLSNPNMQFTFGKGIAGLDLLEVMAELRGTQSKLGQAKAPITNVKIDRVEVAAKDPDRWIAELDARVKRKIQAPTQARGALRHPR